MTLTRAQFARVVGGEEKWVENTARALRRQLDYTPAEAKWLGLVHLLNRNFSIGLARAAELADEALRHSPETRALPVAESADGVAAVTVDMARYLSTFAAALSTAIHHDGPRRRGRRAGRPRTGSAALRSAERQGVDVSLLEAALDRSPAERLARLESNAAFVRAIRPARSRR